MEKTHIDLWKLSNLSADEVEALLEKHYHDKPKDLNQLPYIETAIKNRQVNVKEEMYHIGRLLTRARGVLQHGRFQEWIKDTFDFSYDTAYRLMKVYEVCIGRPSLVHTFKSSVLMTIASNSFPADIRKHLLEHGPEYRDIGVGVVMRLKRGEIDVDHEDVQAIRKFDEKRHECRSYKAHVRRCIDRLDEVCEKIERIVHKEPFQWPTLADRKTGVTPQQDNTIEEAFNRMTNAIERMRPIRRPLKEGELEPKPEPSPSKRTKKKVK